MLSVIDDAGEIPAFHRLPYPLCHHLHRTAVPFGNDYEFITAPPEQAVSYPYIFFHYGSDFHQHTITGEMAKPVV